MSRTLNVGNTIVDNDPHSSGRKLTIREVIGGPEGFVRAGVHPIVRIRQNRIHTDGKQRRSGFSLEQP